jgi:hypothetical protein
LYKSTGRGRIMTKVHSEGGYDFYISSWHGDVPALYYNIVPSGQRPTCGYLNRRYIERVKGIKFPEWIDILESIVQAYYGKPDQYLLAFMELIANQNGETKS